MSRRKFGLKALGLSFLAVLAFSAFAANSAQAVLWKINLSLFHGEETFLGTGLSGELLVKELGLNLTCLKYHISGLIKSLKHGLAVILYELCKVLGAEAVCTVPHITAHVLILLFLHNSHGYILFSPALGSVFAEVDIEGAECSVSTENEPVSGSTVALAPTTEASSQLITPLDEMTLQLLFPSHGLKYGADDAVLDEGTAHISLNGNNPNAKWGAG